jgi:hypothetical protein
VKQNILLHLLIRSGNLALEYYVTILSNLLRWEEIQRYTADEVGEVEDAESAKVHLILGRPNNYNEMWDMAQSQEDSTSRTSVNGAFQDATRHEPENNPLPKPLHNGRCELNPRQLVSDVNDKRIVFVFDIAPDAIGHQDLQRRNRLGHKCTDGIEVGVSI